MTLFICKVIILYDTLIHSHYLPFFNLFGVWLIKCQLDEKIIIIASVLNAKKFLKENAKTRKPCNLATLHFMLQSMASNQDGGVSPIRDMLKPFFARKMLPSIRNKFETCPQKSGSCGLKWQTTCLLLPLLFHFQ
jgi:hypothetical protein